MILKNNMVDYSDRDLHPPKEIMDPQAKKADYWDNGYDYIPKEIIGHEPKKPKDWVGEEYSESNAPTIPNLEYKGPRKANL